MLKRSISPASGQALQEYALAIGLVGLAVVGTLVAMVPQLSTNLGTTMALGSNGGQNPVQDQGQLMANLGPVTIPTQLPGGGVSGGSDGAFASLNLSLPLNSAVANLIEVVGTDGTTHSLAQLLSTFATSPEIASQLTPEQLQAFDALANQGHRLASIQTKLKEGFGNGNGIKFEGKIYSASDLAISLGLSPGPVTNGVAYVPLSSLNQKAVKELKLQGGTSNQFVSPELAKFVTEYQKLQKSIPADKPGVKDTLQNLSKMLVKVNNKFAGAMWSAANNGGMGVKKAEKMVADEVTHDKSANICVTGGSNHKDSGTQCTVN